jgi:NADP-dependent 3-hydroxy acid dehydrogenase YdfG
MSGAYATNAGREFSAETQKAITGDATGDYRGGVRTQRMGDPDDVAQAVLFAIAQPIEVNVAEIVVRPAQDVR